jgi:gas vesicle protein
MRHLAFTIAGVVVTALLGCGDRKNSETGGVSDTSVSVSTPDVSDVPEAPVEARDFSFDDRQGFTASIRQQLTELDARIEELAADVKSKGGAVSDRAVARIRQSRRAAEQSLGRIDNATADTWEDVKTRVNRSVEDLAEAVEGAMPK